MEAVSSLWSLLLSFLEPFLVLPCPFWGWGIGGKTRNVTKYLKVDIVWHAGLFSIPAVIIPCSFIGSIVLAVVAQGLIKASSLEIEVICLSEQMKKKTTFVMCFARGLICWRRSVIPKTSVLFCSCFFDFYWTGSWHFYRIVCYISKTFFFWVVAASTEFITLHVS